MIDSSSSPSLFIPVNTSRTVTNRFVGSRFVGSQAQALHRALSNLRASEWEKKWQHGGSMLRIEYLALGVTPVSYDHTLRGNKRPLGVTVSLFERPVIRPAGFSLS